MKTNAIVRIVLFSASILVLLGVLSVGLGFNVYSADNWFHLNEESEVIYYEGSVYPEYDADGSIIQTFDPAKINNLQIEWAAGSITIQAGDVHEIQIQEFGTGTPMACKLEGNKLTVKFDTVDIHFGITIEDSKDLVITVPKGWNCSKLELEVVAADVAISDMIIQKIDFEGASGACTFVNCSVNELDVDTASGDLQFQGSLNSLEFDAASADCVLALNNTPSKIDLDCASGDVEISLPPESGFTVTMDGMSTDFTSDFDYSVNNNRYVCGDGSCRIEVDAISGDLTIRKSS